MSGNETFVYRRRRRRARYDFTMRNIERHRQAAAAGWPSQRPAALPPSLFEHLSDPERLYRIGKELRSGPRKAPGSDDVRLRDLGNSELGEIARGLSEQIRDQSFRAQVPRSVPIPKRPEPGTRTIKLPSALEHIVATSITDLIYPAFNGVSVETSYGFRKGWSRYLMLAAVAAEVDRPEDVYLVDDDIRKAFDNIQVGQVMDLLRSHGMDERTVQLIRMLVTAGNDDPEIGIMQGSELSPTLMNLLLHTILDVPYRAHATGTLLHRYVDNLAVVCETQAAAEHSRARLQQLLANAGLELKGEGGGIFDLSQQATTLLGFSLRRQQGRIVFGLPAPAETLVSGILDDLARIEDHLRRWAKECLIGWVGSLGPAYQDTDVEAVCETALRTAASYGFRSVVSAGELLARWQKAHQGWSEILTRARGRVNTCSGG